MKKIILLISIVIFLNIITVNANKPPEHITIFWGEIKNSSNISGLYEGIITIKCNGIEINNFSFIQNEGKTYFITDIYGKPNTQFKNKNNPNCKNYPIEFYHHNSLIYSLEENTEGETYHINLQEGTTTVTTTVTTTTTTTIMPNGFPRIEVFVKNIKNSISKIIIMFGYCLSFIIILMFIRMVFRNR